MIKSRFPGRHNKAKEISILSPEYSRALKQAIRLKDNPNMIRRTVFAMAVTLIMTILLVAPSIADQDEAEKEWTGKRADGTILTEADLFEILEAHEIYVMSSSKEGSRADLTGAHLVKAELTGVNLSHADLTGALLDSADLAGADLSRADLTGAHLVKAELTGVNLNHADLTGAFLDSADLAGANLSRADLTGAHLHKVDLTGANLSHADLTGATLFKADLKKAHLPNAKLRRAGLVMADLSNADLTGGDLSGTCLREADLSGANLSPYYTKPMALGKDSYDSAIRTNLREADLSGANLSKANLSRADLSNADLTGVNLREADLSGVNLREANLSPLIRIGGHSIEDNDTKRDKFEEKISNLSRANLSKTNLTNSNMLKVDLSYAIFEPKLGTLPTITSIAQANNLYLMQYKKLSHSLVELREAFKKNGLRSQERRITYAIKHTQRIKAGPIEGPVIWLLFEWTCDYGMSPFKPLKLLGFAILLFCFPYWYALTVDKGKGDIWKAWPENRVYKHEGRAPFERMKVTGIRLFLFGMYFSVLSSFHIGWRDLNIGNWLARIHPGEYSLRATGWIKTVSGIQSLISMYLLVLWILTYFGRPFEW